jgi:putative transposase
MSEALSDGRRFGTFSVVDDFHREALAIEVDFTLTAERTVRVLEGIAAVRGYPLKLKIDNSPEFIDMTMVHWILQHGATLYRASPLRNAFIERFNSQRPRSRTRQVRASNLE